MARSCCSASSVLAELMACWTLPRHLSPPGYRRLEQKQIRAIHTSSFLTAFARLITSGREAVTPAGSNPFLWRAVCPACVFIPAGVAPRIPASASGFWHRQWYPGRSVQLTQLQPSSPRSCFRARSSSRATSPHAGAAVTLCEQCLVPELWLWLVAAHTSVSSVLPGSIWKKVLACKNQPDGVRRQEEA